MHGILAVFLVIGLANAISIMDLMDLRDWQLFKHDFGKNYWDLSEEQYRYGVFQENKRFIEEHNRLYMADEVSYELELNQFADMTDNEFNDLFNNYNDTDYEDEMSIPYIPPAYQKTPATVDWRHKGAVTPVKDQRETCNAGWAFSATGAVEAQHFRKTGKLVSLSEQNLVDCSVKFGNNGCKSGRPSNAFRYIAENEGIDTESSYPYKAKQGKCLFDKNNIAANVQAFLRLYRDNEEELLHATAFEGPISVGVDATQKTFRLYKQGIYDDPNCTPNKLSHALLVVGYGTEAGREYWIVKNSWGEKWGDLGYMKIIRNKNRCGIANQASFPII